MPRASAADAAQTARTVLAVATAHFAEHGYAAASVDEIARAAGVTRGAVYHHYASKSGLFAAVADAIAAATVDSTPSSALAEGSHAFLDAITTPAAARVLLVDGPAVLSWEDWRRLDQEGPEASLRDGLAEAGVAPEFHDALTAALSGAMNELALWLSRRPSDTAARNQAHRTLDRLLGAALR